MNALSRTRTGMIALTFVSLLTLSACGGTAKQAPAAAAPAAPPAPAPAAPAFNKLLIIDSPVRGSSNITDAEKSLLSCVLNSKFKKNEQIVWRIKVVDPTTGQEMDDKVLDKVQVKLADGKTFDAKFGMRPKDKPVDGFWTTSFSIPEDYPPGTLNYGIEVTAKDGRGGQYHKFVVASSALTVLPDVRPKLEKK